MLHEINTTRNGFIPVAIITITPLISLCDHAVLIYIIFVLLLMDSQCRQYG